MLHAKQGNQLHLYASVVCLQFCSLDLGKSSNTYLYMASQYRKWLNQHIRYSGNEQMSEMLLGGTNAKREKPTSKNYSKNQGQWHTHLYYSVIKRKTADKKQHLTEQRTPTRWQNWKKLSRFPHSTWFLFNNKVLWRCSNTGMKNVKNYLQRLKITSFSNNTGYDNVSNIVLMSYS
jgi:hypothetical protein